jgi:glycosyltransferase involved in cell wall biosynthesis
MHNNRGEQKASLKPFKAQELTMLKQNYSFLIFLGISFLHLNILLGNISAEVTSENSLDEKLIVIVIPSYNNKQWYAQNLEKVLSQNYRNFYVIYTDDCSPDGTGDLVEEYLKEYDTEHKVQLIKNPCRRGALHNLYTMIHMCPDNAIVATLDGDDWFPDDEVLHRLNMIYSSNQVWLTYGQFQLHPSGNRGWATTMPDYIVENNAFRDFQHLPTHLRTFYAWLFKRIKLQDLLYLGKFYPMTWDMAMMFPMIEMAGERHQFIADIMYIYNDANSISDHHVSRQLQAYLAQIIKKKPRYKRLSEKPTKQRPSSKRMKADMIVFAESPDKLTQLIQSLYTHVTGVDKLFVMYKPRSVYEKNDYATLQLSYPEIEFCLIADYRSNFRTALFEIYQKTQHKYIIFAKGDTCFEKSVSLAECINALEETQAYAFYFKLNAQNAEEQYQHLPIVECRNSIFAWNFALAPDKWSAANSLDLVLHKKTDSLKQALQSHYDLTPNGLEAIWANEGNLDRLGLCFNENHIRIIN